MSIDKNCVNTLEDIVGDMRNLFRNLQPYNQYRRDQIEPITSEFTPDDIEDVNKAFNRLKRLSEDLVSEIDYCQQSFYIMKE